MSTGVEKKLSLAMKLSLRQKKGQEVDDARKEKKKLRAQTRRARRENPSSMPPAAKPITTEDKRVGEAIANKNHLEYQADNALDEIQIHEDETKTMMVCASNHPGERTFFFMKELCFTIPNCQYFKRKTYPLKKIATFAGDRGFSTMIVIQEKDSEPDSMFVITLPEGPTAYYKISGLKLGSEMKHSVPCNSEHKPEVLVTSFKTRLGLRVGKQLESMFPSVGDDVGRRSVVFHNQRDFIFFRHYRYIFRNVTMIADDEDEDAAPLEREKDIFDPDRRDSDVEEGMIPKPPSCQLKEIGPRFTLRLRSLQLTGTFEKRTAEYEYMWRPDHNVNRAFCEL
jgi:ribosome production factor 1